MRNASHETSLPSTRKATRLFSAGPPVKTDERNRAIAFTSDRLAWPAPRRLYSTWRERQGERTTILPGVARDLMPTLDLRTLRRVSTEIAAYLRSELSPLGELERFHLERELWWARNLVNPESQYRFATLSRDERRLADAILLSIIPRCFDGVRARDLPLHNDAIVVSEALATGQELLITANPRILRDEVNEWIGRNHATLGVPNRPLVRDPDQSVIDLHPHDDGHLELLKTVLAASWSHRDPPAPGEVEHLFLRYTHILADADLPKTAALARERWESETNIEELIFAVSLHQDDRSQDASFDSQECTHDEDRDLFL